MILFAVCLILNLLPVVGLIRGAGFKPDGRIGMPLLNILIIFMMAVLLVEMLIKKVIDKRKDDGED